MALAVLMDDQGSSVTTLGICPLLSEIVPGCVQEQSASLLYLSEFNFNDLIFLSSGFLALLCLQVSLKAGLSRDRN